MADINYGTTLHFYRKNYRRKMHGFNHPFELRADFIPLLEDKKRVSIADLASGPCSVIGSVYKDVKLHIYPSDILQKEYYELWKEFGDEVPNIPIAYQDIEHLTYPDNHFDIVYCANSLDHTPEPQLALTHMVRVCKHGGYVYIRHAFRQRTLYKGMHQWDVEMENGECIFKQPGRKFYLKEFGDFKTHIEDKVAVSIMKKI